MSTPVPSTPTDFSGLSNEAGSVALVEEKKEDVHLDGHVGCPPPDLNSNPFGVFCQSVDRRRDALNFLSEQTTDNLPSTPDGNFRNVIVFTDESSPSVQVVEPPPTDSVHVAYLKAPSSLPEVAESDVFGPFPDSVDTYRNETEGFAELVEMFKTMFPDRHEMYLEEIAERILRSPKRSSELDR